MSANEMTVESLLRAHAPHAPETLRARVLELQPPQRRTFALPSRRLVLVALPAALAIALVAAVVHGVVGSGSKNPTAVVERQVHGAAVGGASTTTPSWDRVRVAAAPAAPTAQKSLGRLAAPTIASSRLSHKAASLQLRVADTDALSHATTQATRIATALGGYAKSVRYTTPKRGEGAAYIELRVPAQNVKRALSQLAGLGTIVSQQLSVDDLQGTYTRQSDQIAQLRRRIAALRTAIADPSLPEAQKVLLRIKLAESKRALAQRLHARKGTLAAGTTADISLVIGTEKSIVPVAHHRGRLGRMLHSAVGFLGLEAIIALYALIVVSPFALVALVLWYLRRRSIDRLLAA
jgi:Domain of unknown function (DUF4349)